MNKGVLIVIGLVAVLGIGGIFVLNASKTASDTQTLTSTSQPSTSTENGSDSKMAQTPNGDATSGDHEDNAMDTNGDAMMKSGSAGEYVKYSQENLTQATANNGTAVLFFHATWCPFCRAAEQDITSRLDEIPAGLTILKTDYDKESTLKKKYGIVSQHTFVQVDAQGNEIQKWNGGDLDEILENTNNI